MRRTCGTDRRLLVGRVEHDQPYIDGAEQVIFIRNWPAARRTIPEQDGEPADRRRVEFRVGRRPVTPHYALFSEVFRGGVRYALEHNGRIPDDFVVRLEAALDGRRLD